MEMTFETEDGETTVSISFKDIPSGRIPDDRSGGRSYQPAGGTMRVSDSRQGVPTNWKVGDIIQNEYEVLDILGQGGMGIVYKVYVRKWHKFLAVKSPKPGVFTKTGGKESFMREAETWVNLDEHPHIVQCDFVQMVDDIPRIFANYIDGGSLADWIRRRTLYQGGTARALERMLDIAIQCAWGLHAAHAQGLVHQDVKPANVMITSRGIAKVTDFGLAKARIRASEQGEQGGTEGLESILVSSRGMTPAYCSPEQAAGRPLSRKTDIWSWGVLVLEMFVGEVTWQSGILAREVLASHETQDKAIPPIPKELVKLLARCFAWQPEERPATLLEVATDVQAIYAHLEGHPYPREMPPPAKIQAVRLNNQALSLDELGRPEEALLALEQAIRLDPTLAKAHNNKSLVLDKLGRREEALLACEQAIRLDPEYFKALYNKGILLDKLGQPEEALLALKKVISLKPTNASAIYSKSLVLDKLGRPEEALLALELAIFLNPTYADALYNKGNVLDKLGPPEEVLLALELAIRLDPTYAKAH